METPHDNQPVVPNDLEHILQKVENVWVVSLFLKFMVYSKPREDEFIFIKYNLLTWLMSTFTSEHLIQWKLFQFGE